MSGFTAYRGHLTNLGICRDGSPSEIPYEIMLTYCLLGTAESFSFSSRAPT